MKFEVSLTSNENYRIFGFIFHFELFAFIQSLFVKKREIAIELDEPLHPHEIGFGGGA